ncbi:hypothetical protein D7V86_06440 [bacterium D16-51]|nr:hypothetical protein D7V96_03280 [bacterium D16-59]RKI61157.1 hypothetical protein D7V86_06440 [bacterium D16-51]
MLGQMLLSEKLEDNKVAAEWGQKQAELIEKGERITQEMIKKYIPLIQARCAKEEDGIQSDVRH